ncbi:hypothetical protein ACFU99_01035 [Streptomyces sp. NPDC057654]
MSSKEGGKDMENNLSMLLAYGMVGLSLLTGLLVLLWMTMRSN